MNPLSATEKEDLRHATLDQLAARHPTAVTPIALARALRTHLGFVPSEADLLSVLESLRGLNLATFERDPLGSTQWWTATSHGLLAVERSAHNPRRD